jgi:hypothetical protein
MPYREAPPPSPPYGRAARCLTLPLLDNLYVASPCPQSWEEMAGDERVRFCWRCEKNVYNLSELTRAEAERLVFEREGAMCVRFYRRADGTILTSDCPPGRRRARRLRSLLAGAVATLLAVLGLQVESPPPPLPHFPATPAPKPSRHGPGWGLGIGAIFGRERSPVTGFEILDRRVDGWRETWTTGGEPPKR